MLLANRLVQVIAGKDDPHKALFAEYFENEDFRTYTLLKDAGYSSEVDWREWEKLKRQAIEEYVSGAEIEMVYRLIDVSFEMDIFAYSDQWEISGGLRIAIDALMPRKDDYVSAIKYYLEKDPPTNGLCPEHCVKTLFSFLPDTEVFEIVKSCGHNKKNPWMYAYYHELPQELITASHLQGLYRFLEDTSDKDIATSGYRNIDFLEKYSGVDKDVLAKGCEIILAKAEYSPFMTGIYFELLHHRNTPKELVKKFQNGNFELLVRIYSFMEEHKRHNDYDGQFLKEIYLAFPPILDKYIDHLVSDSREHFRDNSEKHQRFFEMSNFIEIYDHIYERLLAEIQFPELRISQYLETVLIPRKDNQKTLCERQDKWIKHCIQKHSSDELKIHCLFSFIFILNNDRKRKYMELFLKHNRSFAAFNRIPLTPSIMSWSGSAIPMYQRIIDYLNSLLPLFMGLEWLEHKAHVEKQTAALRKQIKSEEIDEILRG